MAPVITPFVSNSVNAAFAGFFAFNLITMPLAFMSGGNMGRPWVKDLPKNRDHRVNFFARLCGFLLSGYVFTTFLDPYSRMVTLSFAFLNGLSSIHWVYAIFTSNPQYAKHRPDDDKMAMGQWYSTFFLQLVQTIIAILALVGEDVDLTTISPYNLQWNLVRSNNRVLSTPENVNLIAIAMMLFFGIMSSIFPVHFISGFYEDVPERKEGDSELQIVENGQVVAGTKAAAADDEDVPTFMGFKLVKPHGAEYWWFRNISIALLGFIIPAFFEVDMGPGVAAYKSYLWTNSAIYGWSVTTLFQLCSVMNNAYRGVTKRHITMNWIPNLLMAIGVNVALICAVAAKP